MEMTKYKLGDIATIFDGPHATPKRVDKGPIYLGIDAITEDCKINPNEFTFLSEDDYKIWTKRVTPQFKDIVFSYEATLGRYAIIPEEFYGCLGRRLGIIRVNSEVIDYKWLYYFFQSPQWNAYIKNHTIKGSTVNRISVDEMPSYEIPCVAMSEQRKIASVLSALDDKIALNKKMNQKLEAMAKRLYDYWFVQFDFPDENGRPYKTSGGPMTHNPTLNREIPEGWEVKQISEVAKIFNGSTPSTTNEYHYGGDIVWITPKDLSDQNCKFVYQGARNITQAGYDSCSTTMVPKGTVVMSSRAPIGLLSIAQCDLCTNQGFKNMVPNDMTDSKYLYYTIQQHIPQIQNLGTGTTFKEVSKDELGRFAILYPPKKLIVAFEEKVAPIFDVQFNKVKEISRLTTLRDKLLPLLMNCQVTVA